MEFYYKVIRHYNQRLVFQFPTGWNSTLHAKNFLGYFLFQFPTGWNSTRDQREAGAQILVSIPNGMEFYSYCQNFSFFYWQCRFNSQRDGILPTLNVIQPERDGILLRNGLDAVRSWKFQFPTGWNSTCAITFLSSFDLVSIPNGMEFYQSQQKIRNTFTLFQFPTGWNSTWSKLSTWTLWLVSIPNGMEFYKRYISAKQNNQRFNSQRDGILRDGDYVSWLDSECFNSQRDGILRKK